jgi:hypothetical protein
VAASPSFGKCSAPEIIFQTGLDNRKETAFEPKDLTSFPHTSAQNINIISQFICDTFTNSCGANAAAKSLCTQAQAAASAAPAKTGAQADAFNAIFGIKTDFAAVQEVDDQGRPVGTPAAATAAATTTTAAVDAAVRCFFCACRYALAHTRLAVIHRDLCPGRHRHGNLDCLRCRCKRHLVLGTRPRLITV